MKRPIKIYQPAPRHRPSLFAIVPFGTYLNKPIQKASAGAILFYARDKMAYILVRKTLLKVDSGAFTLMFKHVYGDDASWERMMETWRAECIVQGLGKNAFDADNVLLLELKPFVKEEYEAELEQIRIAEEKAERMKAIKELRLKHKDVIY